MPQNNLKGMKWWEIAIGLVLVTVFYSILYWVIIQVMTTFGL